MSIAKIISKSEARKIKANLSFNTQKFIAREMEISEPYLSLILSGKRSIPQRLKRKFKELKANGIKKVSKN